MITAEDQALLDEAEREFYAQQAKADEGIARIVPELADDLAALRAAERDLEERIAPLIAERVRLRQEADAIYQMAEEQDVSDAGLVALAALDRGYERLRAESSALHPYIWEFTRWAPDPDDDRFLGLHGAWKYLGVHISLMRPYRDQDALDPAQGESLAAALVTFAERFVPEFPEAGDFPGMVFAEILVTDDYRPGIWYSRDGSQAAFVTDRRHFGEPEASGTLAEVCAAAIKWSMVDRSDQDGYY